MKDCHISLSFQKRTALTKLKSILLSPVFHLIVHFDQTISTAQLNYYFFVQTEEQFFKKPFENYELIPQTLKIITVWNFSLIPSIVFAILLFEMNRLKLYHHFHNLKKQGFNDTALVNIMETSVLWLVYLFGNDY